MLSAIAAAFNEAFRNLRSNFFQTFLSVLGIVIGVGALVTMLSLIDGLEKLARDGIADNTTMEAVSITPNHHREIDGLQVAMAKTITITPSLIDDLMDEMPYEAEQQIFTSSTTLVNHPDTDEQLAIRYMATSLPVAENDDTLAYGRWLTVDDESAAVMIVNHKLAQRLVDSLESTEAALGKSLMIAGETFTIVGVGKEKEMQAFMAAQLPLAVFDAAPETVDYDASAILSFRTIEEVRPGKEFIETWFAERFADIEKPVEVRASLELVEGIEIGFTIFRLVMSFLIGIAVVVGGVGVMNVLLMSIAERTPEIGVRKAVGANRRRIMTQFLSESVAISAIGSLFGLVFGVIVALICAAVISYAADFDFEAVFSLQTMVVVTLVALITGVVFGTYPARRAAGLDPVRAIQRT